MYNGLQLKIVYIFSKKCNNMTKIIMRTIKFLIVFVRATAVVITYSQTTRFMIHSIMKTIDVTDENKFILPPTQKNVTKCVALSPDRRSHKRPQVALRSPSCYFNQHIIFIQYSTCTPLSIAPSSTWFCELQTLTTTLKRIRLESFVVMPSPRSFSASSLDDVHDYDLNGLGGCSFDIINE